MTAVFGFIILLYMLSSASYIGYFSVQRNVFHRIAYGVLMAGFILHTGLIGYQYVHWGQIPVQNLHQTLSFAAWALAGVYLLLKYRFRIKILGAYTAPLATLIMVVAFCLPQHAPAEPNTLFNSLWLVSHIIIIFIGEASLALAGGTGVLYLIQERAIKTKTPASFSSGCLPWRFWTARAMHLSLPALPCSPSD